MKRGRKDIETVLIQLQSLCSTLDEKNKCDILIAENRCKDKVIKGGKMNKELYGVLHSTRCLDSSLRFILEKYSLYQNEHSLGDYLKRLTNHSSTRINKLPENLRLHFKSRIVDKRNIYMHTSGKFPNKLQYRDLENSMCTCFQVIINLIDY